MDLGFLPADAPIMPSCHVGLDPFQTVNPVFSICYGEYLFCHNKTLTNEGA